jgi:hypothetical protein
MDKFIETVELDSGETVAVGPFHSQEKGQAFAEHIESYNSDTPGIACSRGGMRLLTVDALARELGIPAARLKPTA